MLNVMRKHAGSWMIKVILFAIVIVFVFWGVGSFDPNDKSRVATVNEQIITVSDYRWAYNNLLDQFRQRFGSNLNESMIEMLQLKSQALNQLIERAIILQEARKLDLRVTDTEVAESIMATPVFQTNGSFDNNRYLAILANNRLTPEEYEADQKNVLLSQKVTRIVMGAAKVSDEEARMWFDWQNTSVSVDYVRFEPSRHGGIDPSAEEIQAYFDTHKESYKTEPMVKARYVVFDPGAYREQVSVSDADIADYYDSHTSEFRTEKSVEARHILIKVAQDASEADDRAAREKAQQLAEEARSGEDFAELAKAHSEGPSKDRGGYLGKFGRSQMVKPFADAAFAMQAGEISAPVKTQFGWHVIKVEAVTPASTTTLEQSKGQILAKLKNRQARNLAFDQAEQFYEGSYEKDDLVNNAKTFQLTVQTAGPFARSGPADLGDDKGLFANTAFSLAEDEISEVQEIGERYFIIQTTQRIEAAVPDLKTVETRVKQDLIRQEQDELAHEAAKVMAADLTPGADFEKVAAQHGVKVRTTGLFGRNAPIPEIGSEQPFSAAAFQLEAVGSTSPEPIKGSGGYYLLRLAERKLPASEQYESEKTRITAMLEQQKRQTVFQEWIEARKNSSQIDIDKSILE